MSRHLRLLRECGLVEDERHPDDSRVRLYHLRTFVVGEVLVWDPPIRLVFEFRAAKFEADEVTEVELTFQVEDQGTRVTVEHRVWESIGSGHPARHGMFGLAFRHLMGSWWGNLLLALQQHEGSS